MKFLVPPWQHQLDAIRKSMDTSNYALFFEQGTGKTMTAINMCRVKYTKAQRLMRTLIIGPPIVRHNWAREFAVHSQIPKEKVIVLEGSQGKRVDTLKVKLGSPAMHKGAVIITNYHALLMQDLMKYIMTWGPEVLILDEAHYCKDGKSKRTKMCVKLGDKAKHKFLLTGTPVLNSPMDLFWQYRIMDGGKTFGKNFILFRAKYFWDKNANLPKSKYFPDWKIKPNMTQVMGRKLKHTSMRVKKEECLDLPPLVRQKVEVDLSSTQRKAYEEMKTAFITYVESEACVAQLAITKALRLQQIATGFVKTDDGNIKPFHRNVFNIPRVQALYDLLDVLTPQSKVLVWAIFKENYAHIRAVCEKLGVKYVECHGEIKDKQAEVDKFNNDEEYRVFIGHPGSGGIGINLVVSNVSIFYSRSFSLEQDLQAEARNHRGGSEQHTNVTRYDIVAKETLDEEILKRLASKEAVSESVLKEIARKL